MNIKAIFTMMVSASICQGIDAQIIHKVYNGKLSVSTVELLNGNRSTRSDAQPKYANVYLRFDDQVDINELCKKYDIKLNTGDGRLFTALVPIANIAEMAKETGITQIDAGQDVRTMMDSVRYFTGIDDVYSGKNLGQAYRGKGVIVGIIDAGLDFLHPNFRDADGKCRIKTVWDQNNFFGNNSPYGYGMVYNSTEEVVNAKRDYEMAGDTHGTHVAGIAAGSYDGPYRGVAPEADLAIVSTNKTEQGIVDGIDFLLKYAEEAGQPVAINLSIGTVLGYKDGTDNFTELVDGLMKDRKGQILAIAAGNEGDRRSTLFGNFGDGNNEVASILVPPSYNRDYLFVQGVNGKEYTLSITLADTLADKIVFTKDFSTKEQTTQSFENFGSQEGDNGKLVVSSFLNPENGNPGFRVSMTYEKPENEAWIIKLSGQDGKYMINSDYGEFTNNGHAEYADGVKDYTIAATATGFNTISVGAYVSKTSYTDLDGNMHQQNWQKCELYPLSGKGPTYDGRIKPEITAPGAAVVSSFNSYAGATFVKPEMKVFQITDEDSGRKYSWGVESGTSMATPVVTGTLALWLEAVPDLDVEDIREVLKNSSTHDEFTGESANGYYGMGKLDAEAGLKYLLENVGIGSTADNSGIRFDYDRQAGRLSLYTTDNIHEATVYDVSGIQVMKVKNPSKDIYMNLKQGNVYIIKITSDSTSETFKLVG